MKVELVAKTTGVGKYSDLDSEEIVAAIARHGIIKEDNGKLIKYLMEQKHLSPLDMINFVFEIETSLSIGRQLLRHASIKPQEHSLRYSESLGFEPIELRKQSKSNRQSSTEVFDPILIDYELEPYQEEFVRMEVNRELASKSIDNLLIHIKYVYDKLIEAGVAKECARFVLPNCTTTIMTFNGTLRSWLSLLNVRCDSHAQKECQEIAFAIGNILEIEMPNVFSIIEWEKGYFL